MKKVFIIVLVVVCAFFITRVKASTTYIQGIVKTASSIYTVPEASSNTRLLSDVGGIIVLYSPEAVEVTDEAKGFYQIRFFYSGFEYYGWIDKNNINVKTYTTDDIYEKALLSEGFPEDYAKKITILHAIHPNWSFHASFTGGEKGGMNFNTAVNGEADVIARNLINSANTSLRSTADGAYNNGEWVSLSGSGWYAASKQTIAFFLDPRNFLEESYIFMFENLGYNEKTQTKEVVNKVLGNSFMKNPFDCYEGANGCTIGNHTYADTFIEAAIDKKVSPVHLATRVVQEQGSTGSVLSMGLGYKDEYKGYYNFFNIGASGKTDYDVIMNGLKYAYNRNWNNQYISIYEGSSFLSSNYISRGQSTLYYQKFNTIVPSYYGNQYMQNVKAPYSESYNTYVSYYKFYNSQEEWNNASYDFLIPIYKNMGEKTSLNPQKNGDSTLKSLNITSCEIKDFNSNVKTYECHIPDNVEKIEIKAVATNSLAKVEVPSEIKLTEKETKVQIKVIAADGSTSEYSVTIYKEESDSTSPSEILNRVGLKVNNEIVSNIELGSDISTIISTIKNNYHFARVKVHSNNEEVESGVVKTGDKIEITNNGETTQFIFSLYGDTTGDGNIDIRDLLVIQKYLVKAYNLTDAYLESADINKDGNIDIRDLLLEQKYLLNQYTISQE